MDFLRPASWEEALAAKAEHPTAVPIAGGTDVMVEINFARRRPAALLDLSRIPELAEWDVVEGDAEPTSYVTFQSKTSGAQPAVTIAVAKRKGTNATDVAHRDGITLRAPTRARMPGLRRSIRLLEVVGPS